MMNELSSRTQAGFGLRFLRRKDRLRERERTIENCRLSESSEWHSDRYLLEIWVNPIIVLSGGRLIDSKFVVYSAALDRTMTGVPLQKKRSKLSLSVRYSPCIN